MQNDMNDIVSLQLEVSEDSQNYRLYRELIKDDLSPIKNSESSLNLLNGLIDVGKNICKDKKYKSFRIKVCLEKGSFFLSDASGIPKENGSPKKQEVPVREKLRYEMLTKREKEVLCFLYRGYHQDAIADVFGMSIHTIKKHRYNIYEKTGFKSRTELSAWCEKYLRAVFNIKLESELF